MLGICKSAKSIPRKPQTRFAQTVGFPGNNADFQMLSITKTPADIDKYIYIPERPPDNQILIQFVILSLIQKKPLNPAFSNAPPLI